MRSNALMVLLLAQAATACVPEGQSPVLPAGSVVETEGDTASAGADPAEAGLPITLDDAREIAARFVDLQSANLVVWTGASLGDPAIFQGANEEPVLYEFPVANAAGAAAGAVMVGAREGAGVVPAFFAEGQATFQSLLADMSHACGLTLTTQDVQFYADGPQAVFAALEWPDDLDLPTDEGFLPDSLGTPGIVYYSPVLAPKMASLDRSAWPAPLAVTTERIEEERALREAYATLPDEKLSPLIGATRWTSAIDRLGASGAVGSGAAEFDSWYQESRAWDSGTCNTGCAPLAAGILLDYWDSHGYSSAVAGTNSSHRTTNARSMLNSLRNAMGTWCTSSGEGSTLSADVDNGGDAYTDSRGYSWSWNNDLTSKWSNLMSEIDAERPVLLHYELSTTSGHSAVAYEYTDPSGSASDYVCIKTGWNISPYWQCWTRDTYTWNRITRVHP